MKIRITPAPLRGRITPPPSKSQAHRLILAAALAEGESRLQNVALSQDIAATLGCMRALGAQAASDGSVVRGIGGRRTAGELPRLDCGESGSTLRFLIPVALAVAGGGRFVGRGRLLERPQGPYEALFAQRGIRFARRSGEIVIEGTLQSGEFALAGNISSQFVTGLLYALPLLEGDSTLTLTTPLESRGYVDMTLEALRNSGITVTEGPNGWFIPGNQRYQPICAAVESDYSQAGFFCAANVLGAQVEIGGLNPDSLQGDRIILDFCAQLAQPGEAVLDVRECPDLVPPLAAAATLRGGEITRIVGAARLRMKESDRLETVTAQFSALGADIAEGPDFLTIRGVDSLHGGRVSACNDHRIAMMLAVAAMRADGAVVIDGAECVAKSYPDFWADYEALGGKIERI